MGAPVASLRGAVTLVRVADLDRPELDEADTHHLMRVLRARPGEVVGVTDGRGGWRLTELGSGGALSPTTAVVVEPPPDPPLVVGFAPTKGERPEWAVAKLTELGVDRIVPLVAERSVVRWDPSRWPGHRQRFEEVIRQAAMQSRRVHWPSLGDPTPVLDLAGAGGTALAVPGGDPPGVGIGTVLVGPEGGWSPAEEAAAAATVGLGPTVLRAETATVAAAVVLVGLRHGLIGPGSGASPAAATTRA